MSKTIATLDKSEIKKVTEQKELSDCYIIVERTGKMIRRKVTAEDLPENSIPRDYGKFIGNLLGLDMDNELWAIEPPSQTDKGKHPTQYFSYQGIVVPLVQRAIKLPGSTMEKIKIGLFIGLVIAEMVMLFLIAASMGAA